MPAAPDDPANPTIRPGVTISAQPHASVRLMGSRPISRERNGDDPREPREPRKPREPREPVSVPDLAMQFAPCLPESLATVVKDAVGKALGAPGADIRLACVAGTEHVGVWLNPAASAVVSKARDRGVQQLALLVLHPPCNRSSRSEIPTSS